jgi:hypothetical protein
MPTMDELKKLFEAPQKAPEVPLMLDESIMPKGEVSFSPEQPEKANIPLSGGFVNPQGKVAAPTAGIQTPTPKLPYKDVMKAAPAPLVAPAISEEKVQELKSIYSLDPQVVQAPQAQAPAREPAAESPGFMDQLSKLLPYLTPMAVEALAGGGHGGGVSYGIASDGIMKNIAQGDAEISKQRASDRALENKLAGLKAKGPKSPNIQRTPLRNKETGESFVGGYDKATGALTIDGKPVSINDYELGTGTSEASHASRQTITKNEDIRKARNLGQNIKINPKTGEWEAIINGKAIPLSKPEMFNEKEKKEVEGMVAEYTANPVYKAAMASVMAAPKVNSLLDGAQRSKNPNSIAGNLVVLTMLKQAGNSGAVSDRDAERMGGTQQYNETVSRLTEKFTGKGSAVTLRDIQELREISEIYSKVSQDFLEGNYKESKESFKNRYDFSDEQVDSQLAPAYKPLVGASTKSVKSSSLPEGIDFGGVTQYPPKKNPEATIPFKMDGKLYWVEPSDWEAAKKQYPKAERLMK